MAAQTRTSYDEWLREMYSDAITTAFYDEQLLLGEIARSKGEMSGQEMIFHINSGRNFQVGPRAEDGTLPEVGRGGVKRISFTPKYNYGRFGISGPVMSASVRDGAPKKALDFEMARVTRDIRNEVNRQLYGTGSGKYTDCGTTTASATVNVTTTRGLAVGQPIAIAVKSTGTIITDGAQEILTIPSATTFTVTTVVTTDSTMAVYPVGGAAAAASQARNNALYGLEGIIDERNPSAIDSGVSNYGGIDRTTTAGAFFQGNRLHNSGSNRDLDEDLMMQAVLLCESQGGGECNLIICGNGQWRKYGNILKQDRRYNGAQSTYRGGWKALDFNGIPVVRDPICPPNVMFFADKRTFEFLEEAPFGWVDDDGAILRMPTGASATHTFEGLVWHAGQLACKNPKANCKLADLTE